MVTGRKRPASFRGSRKRTKVLAFPPARIDGSRFAKGIERFMRNGKTPDLSGPIIGNMSLATNVRNPIWTEAQASMFPLLCETTSGWKRPTSPTGGLWTLAKCRAGRGQLWGKQYLRHQRSQKKCKGRWGFNTKQRGRDRSIAWTAHFTFGFSAPIFSRSAERSAKIKHAHGSKLGLRGYKTMPR